MSLEMPADESSGFLEDVFGVHAFKAPSGELSIQSVLLDENISISRDLDKTFIQDSWSYRCLKVARNLSILLLDEKGNLDLKKLQEAISVLKTQSFSLGWGRQHDDTRMLHLLNMLQWLNDKPDFQNALKNIHKPEGNMLAEQVIRETLNLPHHEQITTAHARRAALSALLTKLRQNVGSCFATAPALVIHDETPLEFFKDIADLFNTSRLSRTFGGIQYSVPLSPNWGLADLYRPIFLNSLGEKPIQTLSMSPGLQIAFESISLIRKEDSNEEKQKACELLLKKALILESPVSFVIPDDVLRKALLAHFELNDDEVRSYLERGIEGPLGELSLHAPFGAKSKALICMRYLKDLEVARAAFKSLTDNALLKAWEFTLASFAEAKANFAKWNLYLSLGVSKDEAHGIGRTIYEEMETKVNQINERLEEWQSNYDHLFAQAKYLEGRFQRAQEGEVGWIRAEYEIRKREINKILDERDEMYEKGRKLANLFSFLISFYGEKIPEYFQEIYDAQMHDYSVTLYDDSPAGFRLLYKHGRANPSLWTLIHSAPEYVQHLSAFFNATEIELMHRPETEGIERELSSLITSILTTIKKPEFLESSIQRLARAYNEPYIKDPLNKLDQVKRKPWAYVSGGTMATLVSCYFGNETPPKEVKRWVESETELLAFMIDSMKELSPRAKKKVLENPALPLLAFSPTHAFLLKPGFELFRKGLESDTYTYTWIRDEWINPSLRFLEENILDVSMMEILVTQILKFIPLTFRAASEKALKSFLRPLSAREFRERVIKNLSYERLMRQGEFLNLLADEIDSLLFRTLPYFPSYRLKERLEKVFAEIEIDQNLKEKIFEHFSSVEDAIGKRPLLSAYDLKNYAKALLILGLKKTRSSIPFHQKITDAMQKLKFSYPKPILVGDTNWVKSLFGFVVNPGTEKLEFWRFDESGSEGKPISIWKRYLDGTDKQEWGIYINPSDYGL